MLALTNGEKIHSKIHLIDLAGSEMVSDVSFVLIVFLGAKNVSTRSKIK
jgi:hypothetical protein